MGTSIRWALNVLARITVIAAACTTMMLTPSMATEPSARPAFVGSIPVPYIFDIVSDPFEPGSVLLATGAGVYRAREDGTAERISNAQYPVWSLSAGGINGSRLFARGFADDRRTKGVLVSEDQGESWRGPPLTGNGPSYPRVIEASKANPNIIYATGHRFWRSADGGQRWQSRSMPPTRVLDLAASAIDARRIFAATLSGLHVSEDGGLSWTAIDRVNCSLPAMTVDTGADGVVYAFSLCTGLMRGDELTGSWEVVNDRFGGCVIQHMATDPRNSSNIYAVIRCHKVLMSADGGSTWREFGSREAWTPSCPTYPVGRIERDS